MSGLDCSYCKTQNDFFYNGLAQQLAFYIGTSIVFAVLHLTGGARTNAPGQFWKYWGLFMMFVLEVGLLTQPLATWSGVLATKTISEKIELLHHTFLACVMALSLIAPLYVPNVTSDDPAKLMDRMETLTDVMNREMAFNSHLALEPFTSSDGYRERMQQAMEKMSLDLRLFDEYKEYSDVYMKAKNKAKKSD